MDHRDCINPSLILDMAIKNEERGYQFYKKMKELTGDARAKDIFHKLSEEEKEHGKAIEKIFRWEKENQFNLDEKSQCYLCCIGEHIVFPYENAREFTAMSPKEAITSGIQAKKDSILFYHELLKKCLSEKGREVITHILEEDQMHLVELRDYMDELCPRGCKH